MASTFTGLKLQVRGLLPASDASASSRRSAECTMTLLAHCPVQPAHSNRCMSGAAIAT
jgi:hypothetical protein